MNSFFNKKLSKLIIIPVLFVILFNCIFPTFSSAYEGMGGTLFGPIRDLVCGIGDVILNVLQNMPGSPTAIDKRSIAELETEAAWEERRNSRLCSGSTRNGGNYNCRYSLSRRWNYLFGKWFF